MTDDVEEAYDGFEMPQDSFLHHLCEYTPQFSMLLGICLFILALSGVSLAFVRPGTATYVVVLMNIAGLLVFSALFGGLILLCKRQ